MTPASIGIDLGATHVRAAINDARAAALAEACLVVTVGTGIGGGLVINGRLHTGTGHSGEIGHILIDPHAPPCRCDEADAHPEGPTASAAAGRQPNVAGLVRAAATSDSAAIGIPDGSSACRNVAAAADEWLSLLQSPGLGVYASRLA
jgi:hypothetical protein